MQVKIQTNGFKKLGKERDKEILKILSYSLGNGCRVARRSVFATRCYTRHPAASIH